MMNGKRFTGADLIDFTFRAKSKGLELMILTVPITAL